MRKSSIRKCRRNCALGPASVRHTFITLNESIDSHDKMSGQRGKILGYSTEGIHQMPVLLVLHATGERKDRPIHHVRILSVQVGSGRGTQMGQNTGGALLNRKIDENRERSMKSEHITGSKERRAG